MSSHSIFLKAGLCAGLLLYFSLTASAAFASPSSAQEEVTLVRLKPDPNAVSLTAQMEGKLQVRQGCVYLITKKHKLPVLAIWPSTYRLLSPRGKPTGVLDTSTGWSLEFSVNGIFGGGETKIKPTDMLDAPIPTACGGTMAFVEFSP
ncbi:hypothetical protein [Pseudomonas sp. CGJS7]|uniref:hypothetical protein n=1 Tax=Pseudomonas sp. CGJS7 TaxID=3109348 RepID=UPI00300A2445